MLDLQIKELKKVLTTSQKKADFLRKRITVTEKLDGTKLTLIRNSEPFDETDYTKNWIVAYKENVLFPGEYTGIENDRFWGNDSEGDVAKHSIGTSQYGMVHEHLKTAHKRCESIPCNTEFFIEFIQRKHTLTRDYKLFFDMFLIGYASATYIQQGQRVFSAQQPLETHILHHYAPLLDMKTPPVLFDGLAFELGSVDDIIARYENMKSSLGGIAEGVVIRTGDNELYKVVAKDQYSKEVRREKKQRWMLDTLDDEKAYWSAVYAQAHELVNDVMIDNPGESVNEIMTELSCCVYNTARQFIDGKNNKKATIILQDDLFLTAKLHYERVRNIPKNAGTCGIYVMSGKPVHAGHWHMIEMATRDNHVAYVFVSSHSRGEEKGVSGADMLNVWKENLVHYLPANVVLRFSDNPMIDSFREVHNLTSDIIPNRLSFRFYADEDDARERYSDEKLKTEFPRLMQQSRIAIMAFGRDDIANISGTKMRQMLAQSDEEHRFQFMMHLPSCMTFEERERTWKLLRGDTR